MDSQTSQEFQGRRRSKPKFEIPIEAGLPQAAGWIYKATVGSAHESAAEAEPLASRLSPATLATGPLLTAGAGLFFLGFQIVGRLCVSAIGFSSIPVTTARRLLILDRS